MRWRHKVFAGLGLRTRAELEAAWDRADRAEQEARALRGQVEGLKRHLRELTKARDAIREEAEVQAQADQWRLRQAEQGKAYWLNRANELVDQVRALEADNGALRDHIGDLSRRIIDLEAQVEAFRGKGDTLEREAAILRQERDHALNQRDEALAEAHRWGTGRFQAGLDGRMAEWNGVS